MDGLTDAGIDDALIEALIEAKELAKRVEEEGKIPVIRIAEAGPNGGYELPAEEFKGRDIVWRAMRPSGEKAVLVGHEERPGVEKEA